jgi:uncharacterized protein YdeI (YjbR/CyaY-like superfamily)
MKAWPAEHSPLPILLFERQEDWASWLDENHEGSAGLWLQLAKKGGGARSVSYDEAVEIALCYGWIDGQMRAQDERFYIQRFTRRSDRSIWSKINREKALALAESGWMKPAGLEAIERAKVGGRWDEAYDSSATATVPEDLRSALDANERARSFFETLDRANRYAVLFRIQTAVRPDTRAQRISQLVQMLERHEKVHP